MNHFETNKQTIEMRVSGIQNAANSRGFSVPHVFGETSNGEASFPISNKASQSIQPGQVLLVVETGDSSNPYLMRETLDQHLSEIVFSAAGLSFNHIAILGGCIALGALGWGLFGKAKRIDPPTKQ